MSDTAFHRIVATRDRLSAGVDHGPEHLRQIVRAVRDFGCAWVTIEQGAGPFRIPNGKPSICILGDDTMTARGPVAFSRKSVRRYIRRCGTVVIVSCEPLPDLYGAAAACASVLRRDALVIESQPRWEQDWIDLVRGEAPGVPLLIGAVRPEGGLH